MSDYTVFSAVSVALQRLLWDAIKNDPALTGIVPGLDSIVFTPPEPPAKNDVNDPARRLSLWLYQVSENEFMRNDPPAFQTADTQRDPPLTLNLSYLLTPFARTGDGDHLLLGRAMQVLHGSAIVLVHDVGVDEELRVALAPLTLGELTAIWDALRIPYRLSVAYQVRVVRLDSDHTRIVVPVTRRVADWSTGAATTEAVP